MSYFKIYGIIAMVSFILFLLPFRKDDSIKNYPDMLKTSLAGFVAGVFWPVTIPVAIGMVILALLNKETIKKIKQK